MTDPDQLFPADAQFTTRTDGSCDIGDCPLGWRSPQMLRRYGASAADQRARAAHKRLGLGDMV